MQGIELKKLRISANLTQSQLSELVGLSSKVAIAMYENETRAISKPMALLFKLAISSIEPRSEKGELLAKRYANKKHNGYDCLFPEGVKPHVYDMVLDAYNEGYQNRSLEIKAILMEKPFTVL